MLEKGIEYEQKRIELTDKKVLELSKDPELTFKPMINSRKPPRN